MQKTMNSPTASRSERFAELYRREFAVVLGFVRRRCARYPAMGALTSESEDIVHEAFMVAWRKFDDAPDDPDRAPGWLLTIARNCLLNAGRGEARRGAFQRLVERDAVLIAPPVDDEIGGRIDLAATWASLSAAEREVIALTAIDELSSAQAATVLGISTNAYRHRLSRARQALRKRLTTNTGLETLNLIGA